MRNQESRSARVRIAELRAILSAIAPDSDPRLQTLDALIAIKGAAERAVEAPTWLGELKAALLALETQ